MIEVFYDGKYPNMCSGTLIIKEDGIDIYNKRCCCKSTGCVWFDDEWCDHIESGDLLWNEEDAKGFSEEIQNAVKDVLSSCFVCCGGCI